MKIHILKSAAKFFGTFDALHLCRRVGENEFVVELDNKRDKTSQKFLFDLNRSVSNIYACESFSSEHFAAPFDKKLAELTTRATLEKVEMDGENRILRFFLASPKSYKITRSVLHFEFTGKHTNVILTDENFCVIAALRHVVKSVRPVEVGKILLPLPQICHKSSGEILESSALLEHFKAEFHAKNANLLAQKKAAATNALNKKIAKNNEVLASLPNKNALENLAKTYANYGSLILSNLHNLPRVFGESIEIDGLKIPLPTELKEHKNNLASVANFYFNSAKKLTKKAKNLALQIQNLEQKNAFLRAQISIVKSATTPNEAEIFTKKLPKTAQKTPKIYESFFINGTKISFGKSEKENIALLKDAKAHDMWLHIRDVAGAHMIIHSPRVEQDLVERAAKILVALHKNGTDFLADSFGADSFGKSTDSALKKTNKNGDFLVDYTLRKFVKMNDGARVNYAKYGTLNA